MLTWLATAVFVIVSAQGATGAPPSAASGELHCGSRVEMGTEFKICVYAPAEKSLNVRQDLNEAFDGIKKMDAWMSDWRPETELSRVNQAAGARAVKVSKELFGLVAFALEVARESQGAFDPTFNAFWGLYKFKKGEEREPTDEEIAERLPLIDYRNVTLNRADSTILLKKPSMKLGLGGLGQGYAVDKTVELLKKRGYAAGYVDGSGDTYFWGKKPTGELWTAGVRDPSNHERVVARVYGTDFAVTTCGDDEKFFLKNGRRVHHIIDTKSGRPATRSRQTTVIARRALDADAFDTASFVLGPVEALKLLKSKDLEGVLIGADGRVTLTPGLKKRQTEWGEVLEAALR
ncbi:MAG TPA: FAD:protein FMN transferase [Bdellovibrionales bacterium]|nr:FAD:protein FMN transferase [Bdellovibrionales bacterium]